MTIPAEPPPDPYAVLGIEPGASSAEITTAYRSLVRRLHPDNPHAADPERLRQVIIAYQTLRDSHRREWTEEGGRAVRRAEPEPHSRAAEPRVRNDPPGSPVARPHLRRPNREPDLRAGPVRYHPPPDRG